MYTSGKFSGKFYVSRNGDAVCDPSVQVLQEKRKQIDLVCFDKSILMYIVQICWCHFISCDNLYNSVSILSYFFYNISL